ncbi:NEAT domain-containing protein [Secundilactobacillus paracollinoides]|uniref:NEAT domain-containing protein n=1 Tax=Secundilactobacillus paracollinoides TaxID=240427 RepID=UPI0006D24DA3|nr:NEAT domain-containing protein [Secundilactobacillus paracollinoides]KRL80766.1 cell surface protein [Secundilactobacillus paracollinoides DSM 15502 = JCM 11969]
MRLKGLRNIIGILGALVFFALGMSAVTTQAHADSSSSSSSSSSQPSQSSSIPGKTVDPTTGWTYVVLQADSNSKSIADQYYTHVAKITPIADNKYQVTLEVSYAKSLGMGSKGVVPLTIDGQKAHNVTYGTSGSNYTVTYSFYIDNLDALNNVIDGTIHVTVPVANISQDFGVRFKFSHAASADTGSTGADKKDSSSPATTNGNGSGTTATATSPDKKATATVNPGSNNATGSSSKSYLPQTNEQKQQSLMMLGFLAVASLIGFTIYKRRHA